MLISGKKIDSCDSWSQELNVRWIPCPLMFLFCYNTAHQITLNIISSNNCDSFTDTAEPMISHPNHLSGTQSVFHVCMVRRSSPLITGKKQLVLFSLWSLFLVLDLVISSLYFTTEGSSSQDTLFSYNGFLWFLFLNFWVKTPSNLKQSQKPHTVVRKSDGHNSLRDSLWLEYQG